MGPTMPIGSWRRAAHRQAQAKGRDILGSAPQVYDVAAAVPDRPILFLSSSITGTYHIGHAHTAEVDPVVMSSSRAIMITRWHMATTMA